MQSLSSLRQAQSRFWQRTSRKCIGLDCFELAFRRGFCWKSHDSSLEAWRFSGGPSPKAAQDDKLLGDFGGDQNYECTFRQTGMTQLA